MTKKRVIVIGGGPAGLMAAGQAKENGADVILLEKMKRPGRKLGITGKGRCNVTNNADIADFINHFGKNGRFLRQAFSRFFAPDLVEFFRQKGLALCLERGGRYFPASGKAMDIVKLFLDWLQEIGVQIKTQSPVDRIIFNSNKIEGVKVGKHSIAADAVIIATGGCSYPATGSTGDGYALAKAAGHSLITPRPALVPLKVSGGLHPNLAGLEIRNCTAKLLIENKIKQKLFGELHFLHNSIGGPIVLSLSGAAVDGLQAHKKVSLILDIKPALDESKLDNRLIRDLNKRNKEPLETMLRGLLPTPLVTFCLQQTALPPELLAGKVTKKERKKILYWLKHNRFEISGFHSFAKAIVTAGGVKLSEIHPKTMESKFVSGLYLAGEVLDLDGDTGGYNLQAAFSTGWLAGRNAACRKIAQST